MLGKHACCPACPVAPREWFGLADSLHAAPQEFDSGDTQFHYAIETGRICCSPRALSQYYDVADTTSTCCWRTLSHNAYARRTTGLPWGSQLLEACSCALVRQPVYICSSERHQRRCHDARIVGRTLGTTVADACTLTQETC